MSDVVERAKASLEGVTNGAWEAVQGTEYWWVEILNQYTVAVDIDAENARFIAAARTLVPELIAEIERSRGIVAEFRRRDESADRVIDGLKREVRAGLAEIARLREAAK